MEDIKVTKTSYGQRSISDHDYKGYIIRLQFSTLNGGWYKIFKVVNNKWYPLRAKGWNFILPEYCLEKAKNYIDEFGNELEEKVNRKIEFIKNKHT